MRNDSRKDIDMSWNATTTKTRLVTGAGRGRLQDQALVFVTVSGDAQGGQSLCLARYHKFESG